jgi:hypothetical protein
MSAGKAQGSQGNVRLEDFYELYKLLILQLRLFNIILK